MNIFVTGGSGFLGKTLLAQLSKLDHQVWGLARSTNSSQIIEKFGAKVVQGDLDRLDAWHGHLKGIDVVVHCASPVEFWGPWEKFERDIVGATLKLAEYASRNGVKRFIYISSESVLQDKLDLVGIDERHPYPKKANSFYGEAKKLAEQGLLGSNLPMEIIILRPTFIWGKGCPALRTIQDKVNSGKFIWIGHGESQFEAVHVDNVASAIVLALTKGLDRAVYFITDGERATVKGFFTEVFHSLNLPVPTKSIPSSVAIALASVTEGTWNLLGIQSPPPLSRFELSFVQMSRSYEISRAKSELQYLPKTRRVGFQGLATAE